VWPFRRRPNTTTPPVDMDMPVTNPALTAAMAGLCEGGDQAAVEAVIRELNRAVYLVAILLDEASVTTTSPGQAIINKGSMLNVLQCTDSNDRPWLPLFTDWDAIRKWTNNTSVSTLVMPSDQAWDFALSQYQGVVINPAGPSLKLSRDQLEDLRRRGQST